MNRQWINDMSSIAFDAQARDWAPDLEDRERLRTGAPLPAARKAVARRIGVSAGTLETLRSGRRKSLGAWLFAKLQNAVIAELQREIERCSHDLALARQIGLEHHSDKVAALEAAVRHAQTLIEGGA